MNRGDMALRPESWKKPNRIGCTGGDGDDGPSGERPPHAPAPLRRLFFLCSLPGYLSALRFSFPFTCSRTDEVSRGTKSRALIASYLMARGPACGATGTPATGLACRCCCCSRPWPLTVKAELWLGLGFPTFFNC